VFAGQCGVDRAALAALLGAIAVTSAVFAWLGALDVSAQAFCIVAASATALARPSWKWLPPLAAGIVAAGWISILRAQGLPWLPAALLASAVLAVACVLAARRAGFAPAEMRDEALVIVGLFALLLAVGPDVVAGWQAGMALMAEPLSAEGPDVGPWWAGAVLGSAMLGGAYAAWKRR
jgi:hypothetical protein